MALELDRVQKPLRELRKSLKRLPKNPPPETVHKLRIRARQIEAIAPALTPSEQKKTQRLLKSLKPVRKAAGKLRDMDVLAGNALSLPQDGYDQSLDRLMKELEAARQKNAGALHDTVGHKRKSARHILKQYSKLVRAAFEATGSGSAESAVQSGKRLQAAAGELTRELRRWPALSAANIHRFRLKIKELRSVLQILIDSDAEYLEALGKVKDQIGDWHDWQQLAGFARQFLDARKDRALLAQIERTRKQRLGRALDSANALRARYLTPFSRQKRGA